MRKFRNLVIGGIENKIFNLILITVILLTVAFGIIMTDRRRSWRACTRKWMNLSETRSSLTT